MQTEKPLHSLQTAELCNYIIYFHPTLFHCFGVTLPLHSDSYCHILRTRVFIKWGLYLTEFNRRQVPAFYIYLGVMNTLNINVCSHQSFILIRDE